MFYTGLWWPLSETDPYLQLEPDLTARFDTGQAELPPVDAQEHSMRLNGQHVYLLWEEQRGGAGCREKR